MRFKNFCQLIFLVLLKTVAAYPNQTLVPKVSDIFDIYNYSTLLKRSNSEKEIVKIMENDHEMNRYSIRFISTELDKSTPQLEKQTETVAQYKQFYLKFDCDGTFNLQTQMGESRYTKYAHAIIYGGDKNPVIFTPEPNTNTCYVSISDTSFEDKNFIKLKLSSEKNYPQHKIIQDLRRSKESCNYETSESEPETTKVILKHINTNNYFSCLGSIEISPLDSGLQALREKVKLLLGQDLSDEVYNNRKIGDDIHIDFSKAPRFKAILISTLIFEDDFYGYLIGRLLEFHASRGTVVKILVSKNTLSFNGKNYINYLTTHYPNINIKSYTWIPDIFNKNNSGRLIDGLHRVQHAKYFLTLGENEEQSRLFIGGRNIGSAYLEPVENSKSKNLYFEDFQAIIKNKSYIYSMAQKIISLWDMDSSLYTLRANRTSYSQSRRVDFTTTKDVAADLISVPFTDERRMEKFYIDLIDAASKSIDISSPYFSPTPSIKQALKKAALRGVEIKVLTNISLNGDTGGSFITDINRIVINELQNIENIKIYAFQQPYAIYHAKYMLIDNYISLVGSVNLNQRSFIHDVENLSVVIGYNYNYKMKKAWNEFVSRSKSVSGSLPILGIGGPLLKFLAEDLD